MKHEWVGELWLADDLLTLPSQIFTMPCHCTIFQFGWNFTNTCSFLPSTFLIHFVRNSFKSAHKLHCTQRLLKPYIGFPFPHIGLTPVIPTPQSVVVPVVVGIVCVLVISCVVIIIIIVGVVIVKRRQSSKYSVHWFSPMTWCSTCTL